MNEYVHNFGGERCVRKEDACLVTEHLDESWGKLGGETGRWKELTWNGE
jgi:hypothetical protein